ncbi:flotillin family protein [Sediminitomix flava]|uniref:Flotillin n=1 Tax=Sediminitomix flava TaxID=379075 RepID=A0A315YWN6_SEDFL|nr:flotillin family protein [Sediminitomix flava]PWJ33665.1 flotillin [Sediminitomix flava]
MELFGIVGSSVFGSLFLFILFLISRYKRCPSNKVLVIYGKVGKGRSAKCIHGGGSLVWPVIQSWQFLHLTPINIEIDLSGALSKQNIRINTPSTFTVGISTNEHIMLNAAERLLGLEEHQIKEQALDIILGQLRLVIATLDIEEINQDREQFLALVNKHVASELNKVGLELINVNIKDITDDSGYIEAIGKKAAAEAVNKARVEVAVQETSGATGEAKAQREREIRVAEEQAGSEKGKKEAETEKRVKLAELETVASIGEANSQKEKDVQLAIQAAEAEEGKKEADAHKRVKVAGLEAEAIEGENISKAKVADYNAELAEKTAAADRKSEVARANAKEEILKAEKEVEKARLQKEEVVLKEIEKQKIEIEADAKAAEIRRIAQGEADAQLMKFQAEAEGLRKVLEAKAEGYQEIIKACGGDTKAAATLLLLEKLEELVGKQTEAMANLKIDKITVWESGGSEGGSSTSNFIKNFIGALPPMHELAKQAGIDLPQFLGDMSTEEFIENNQIENSDVEIQVPTGDEKVSRLNGAEITEED